MCARGERQKWSANSSFGVVTKKGVGSSVSSDHSSRSISWERVVYCKTGPSTAGTCKHIYPQTNKQTKKTILFFKRHIFCADVFHQISPKTQQQRPGRQSVPNSHKVLIKLVFPLMHIHEGAWKTPSNWAKKQVPVVLCNNFALLPSHCLPSLVRLGPKVISCMTK